MSRDGGEQLCKKGNMRDRRDTYRILDNIKADFREVGCEDVGGGVLANCTKRTFWWAPRLSSDAQVWPAV